MKAYIDTFFVGLFTSAFGALSIGGFSVGVYCITKISESVGWISVAYLCGAILSIIGGCTVAYLFGKIFINNT